ncbi:MAG: GHKL domain-containing protein [Proteobacteria bacterium]|nr:GHKL domain-containing protein [Pseudomonadota bacterium]MBU1419158.1 GHKL domain-containing protein [Pseudomonadota bacterium]MBU1455116.1 GHKL domain-containing protein [Pseudomonadota bacterium]
MNNPEHLQQLRAGFMPFQLVKYFSFTSLAVILIFTLVLSWIISNNARTVMLDQSEAYSLLLAENLNQQVFRSFVLPTVVTYGKIALSNPDQFQNLDRVVRNATEGMKVETVTIYDSTVNIISYSTDEEQVGKKDMGGLEYLKALAGTQNSQIVSSGSVLSLLPGTAPVHCRLKTFIPFRQVRGDKRSTDLIMGVIEITQDLSREYSAIMQLQGRIILVSSLVMAILFLVLRTIVSRADKIMEKRVHERLSLEEKLNRAERLAHLGTMVATVSHEIKSPLGIVRSTAEILYKRIKKVAPGNENLAEIIVAETTRLNNIVMEFLDFARPQMIKLTPVDINDNISKALQFIDAKLQEQKIALETDFHPKIGKISIDPDLFYRALLNILVNAIQAMPEGGVLRVNTGIVESDGSVFISIQDSGIGMSEEKAAEIFKPFFTDKNRGTGLGLAITKNIVEQHHGTISVISRENEGSTFTITLP